MKKTILLVCAWACMLMGALLVNAQWITLNSGTSVIMDQVFFPSDSLGYLLGDDGNIFKTINGGLSWTNPSITTCGSIFFVNADTGYGGGIGTGVFKTIDGASTWNNIIPTTDNISSLLFERTGNTGYAIGNNASSDSMVTYKTIDGGNNWNRLTMSSVQNFILFPNIFFTDTNTGYLVDGSGGGGGNTIFSTSDGGLSWSSQFTDTTLTDIIYSVYFPTKDTGYAVGGSNGSLILKTTDGQHWVQFNQSVTSSTLTSVWFTSANRGFAVDGDGGIIETSDGGQTWTLDINTTISFTSVYFPSQNVGYACGSNGEVLKYDKPAGIWELTDQCNITLSPNPATNQLTIHPVGWSSNGVNASSFHGNEAVTVSVMNVLGQNASPPAPLQRRGESAVIDVSGLSAGIYFLQLKSESGSVVKKFIKE